MTRYLGIASILLLTASFLLNCQTIPQQPIVEEDGRRCGAVAGAFRGRWWSYFERGQSYAECQMWAAAAQDYHEALAQRTDDNSRARTYGMNFVAYFPHRELGVSLYHRQRYDAAIEALETSLSHEISAKAQYYLDRARKAWIQTKGLDRFDPEIQLSAKMDPGPTNAFTIGIQGVAKDDTYVKRIRINGREQPIDLGAAEIPFAAEIPLQPGSNQIRIEAVDICGNATEWAREITSDRSGPLINFNSIQRTGAVSSSCRIKGFVSDPAGVRSIRINGESLPLAGGETVDFQYPFDPTGSTSEIVITAEDGAGNATTAVVDPRSLLSESDGAPLLAASGPLFRFISKPETCAPAGVEPDPTAYPQAPLTPYLASTTNPQRAPRESGRGVSTGKLGRNFALIVGIDDYEYWPRLKTAVNDAGQLAQVLTKRYGFAARDITLLLNQEATEDAIIDALLAITGTMGQADNLLVYFAGHGKLHALPDDGYWIPVAGRWEDTGESWIAHSAVRKLVSSGRVRGKNILVITDSCYGARFLRGGQSGELAPRALTSDKLLTLSARKSRQIIASGSQKVSDQGWDGHSIFAYYLLRALEENEEPYVSLSGLVRNQVWEPVYTASQQVPAIGRFNTPMDDGGEFVLHLSGLATTPPDPADEIVESIPMGPPPTIVLKGWEAQQTVFLERAYIDGHISHQNSITDIHINGRSLGNRRGLRIYFNEWVPLALGDNPLVVEAFDEAGNRARMEIHIYRKPPAVDAPAARLKAVMLPHETTGEGKLDIQGALFDYVDDSRRFNLKYWQAPRGSSSLAPPGNGIDGHLVRELQDEGIDCALTGKIHWQTAGLEIRTRVVALEDHSVLAKADVYGEDLDREKIRTLCRGLVNKIRRDLPVVEGEVRRVRGKKIVIDRGRREGLKIGMPLILFEEEELKSDTTGESLGTDRRSIAAARIDGVQEKMSHAVLTTEPQSEIVAGQKVITK